MKKYKIIYADPPWRYARSKVQGAAEKHYPTMSIEELCALPVKEIADKDCILFLWATFPQLKERRAFPLKRRISPQTASCGITPYPVRHRS